MSVPEGVDPRELDQEVRSDLRSLAKDTAELAAQHLIMTGRLIDEDPVQALAHARAATALAGRVAAVREAAGLAAYAAQEWALALAELRTARRISGRPDHLAVLADCERALGRPERALAVLDDPDVASLDQATRVELVIVVAGARRDLGELDAAVLLLQVPAQGTKARHPWAARLWYAYADALHAAGRPEARDWFERAAEIDEGETEALDRLLELDGVVFTSGEDDDEDAEGEGPSVSLEELGLQPVTQDSAAPPSDDATVVAGRDPGHGAPAVGEVHGVDADAVAAAAMAVGIAERAETRPDRADDAELDRLAAAAAQVAEDLSGADGTNGVIGDRGDVGVADAVGAAGGAGSVDGVDGAADDGEKLPSAPAAASKSRQIDEASEVRPSGVAAPLFSHDEEPAPKPPVVGLPGQQDLFSDLED